MGRGSAASSQGVLARLQAVENSLGWFHLNPNGQLRDAEEVAGD